MKFTAKELKEWNTFYSSEDGLGPWIPARPERYGGITGFFQRIKEAILVIRDKADIVVWEE